MKAERYRGGGGVARAAPKTAHGRRAKPSCTVLQQKQRSTTTQLWGPSGSETPRQLQVHLLSTLSAHALVCCMQPFLGCRIHSGSLWPD